MCVLGYQLVTLSRDRTVRLWSLSEQLKQDLGGELPDHVIPSVEDEAEEDALQLSNDESSVTLSAEAETTGNKTTSSKAPVEEAETSFMGDRSWTPSPTKSLTRTQSNGSSPLLVNKFQPQVAHTLSQEFSLLNLDNIPNLIIERVRRVV